MTSRAEALLKVRRQLQKQDVPAVKVSEEAQGQLPQESRMFGPASGWLAVVADPAAFIGRSPSE